jgi:hypothetical protein
MEMLILLHYKWQKSEKAEIVQGNVGKRPVAFLWEKEAINYAFYLLGWSLSVFSEVHMNLLQMRAKMDVIQTVRSEIDVYYYLPSNGNGYFIQPPLNDCLAIIIDL